MVISLNVQGLQNHTKRRTIFEYYRKRCDILCLQETHSEEKTCKLWAAEWGGRALFSHGDIYSKGVCVLFHPKNTYNINKITCDHNGHFLICAFTTEQNNTYVLCNVYGPNADTSTFFDSLTQNLCEFSSNRLIVGDFNVVLDPKLEGYKSAHNNKCAEAALKEMMADLKLTDIWRARNQNTVRYSWRRENNQASRIDFGLLSAGIDQKCDNTMYLQGILTDHSAFFLSNSGHTT